MGDNDDLPLRGLKKFLLGKSFVDAKGQEFAFVEIGTKVTTERPLSIDEVNLINIFHDELALRATSDTGSCGGGEGV